MNETPSGADCALVAGGGRRRRVAVADALAAPSRRRKPSWLALPRKGRWCSPDANAPDRG
jgi:hypothetical protein